MIKAIKNICKYAYALVEMLLASSVSSWEKTPKK